MKSVMHDLELEHLWVLYPGDKAYPLASKVSTLPIASLQGGWQYN